MTTQNARVLVYELLSLYFSGAAVTYAKQSNVVKPQAPLVTLNTISINRPISPPTAIVEGETIGYYPTTMIVQVDLYTNGETLTFGNGLMAVADNTAMSDLVDFCNFVGSSYCVDWCHDHDIAIIVNRAPQDATDLLNNSNYQFRATLELSVRFTQRAIGYAGILDESSIKHETPEGEASGDDSASDAYIDPEFKPNASGGGSEEMAEESTGYFTSVEITYTKEE